MAKKKVGGFVKGLFKVIFAVIAIAAGGIALATMAAPGLTALVEGGGSFLGMTFKGSIQSDWSLYVLAFGGTPTVTTIVNGSTSVSQGQAVEMNAGVLTAFILLCAALFFSVVYFIFAWGNSNAMLKKAFGIIAFLLFIAAAVLFFLTKQMNPGLYTTYDSNGQVVTNSEQYFKLGAGAWCSAIFSIVGGISIGVASVFGPSK